MVTHMQAVTFEPGEELTPPDGHARWLVALTDGWAARVLTGADGRTRISGVFLKGELCDPLWLTGSAEESVIALTRVQGVLVLMDDVSRLLGQKSALRRKIFTEIARRSVASARWLCNFNHLSAMQRVGYVLCDLADRLGHRATRHPLRLRIPLEEVRLADMAGVTVSHLRRVVAELRASDLANLTRCTLRIADLGRLQRVSRYLPVRQVALDWPRELTSEA